MSNDAGHQLDQEIQDALQRKDWSRVLTLTEQRCQEYADGAMGWYWRGGCLLSLGRFDDAMTCARRAQALAPDLDKATKLVLYLESQLAKRDVRTPASTSGAEQQGQQPQPVRQARETTTHEPPRDTQGEDGAAPRAPERDHATAQAPPEAQKAPPPTPDEPSAQAAVPPPIPTAQPAPDRAEQPKPRHGAPAHAPTKPAGAARKWEKGTLLENRYEVVEVIGNPDGDRYGVFDRELGQTLLMICPQHQALGSAEARHRVLDAGLSWVGVGAHPNLRTAYFFDRIASVPQLLVEHVQASTLSAWLAQATQVTAERLLGLVIQLATGFEYLHASRWIDADGNTHRGVGHGCFDLSRAMVTPAGVLKITDCGMAAFAVGGAAAGVVCARSQLGWGTMSVDGMALGSPETVCPELWLTGAAEPTAADMYAFGCVMYQLICRRPPFAAEPQLLQASASEALASFKSLHCLQSPPQPGELVEGLDSDLNSLIMRCLDKDPATRQPDFTSARQALEEVFQRLVGTTYEQPGAQQAPSDDADVLTNLGVSCQAFARPNAARRRYQQALELDERHTEAAYNLALSGWMSGGMSDEQAIMQADKGRSPAAQQWRHPLLGGKLRLLCGDFKGAVESLHTAATCDQHPPEVVRELAFALVGEATASGTTALLHQAAEQLSNAGPALGKDAAVLVASAVAFAGLGDVDTAQRLYEGARSLRPDLPADLEGGACKLIPGACYLGDQTDLLGRVLEVALDAAGSTALARGDGERFMLCDLQRQTVTKRLSAPAGEALRCLALDASGALGVLAAGAHNVEVWDLEKAARLRKLELHTGVLNRLVILEDTVAAGGADGRVTVWQLSTGKRTLNQQVHEGSATSVALAKGGNLVISGGVDGVVCVTDGASGDSLRKLVLQGEVVTCLATCPNADIIVAGTASGVIAVFSTASDTPIARFEGHGDQVVAVAVSPDRHYVLSGSADATVRLWDLRRCEAVMATRTPEPVTSMATSQQWNRVVVAHKAGISHLRLAPVPEHRPQVAAAVRPLLTAQLLLEHAKTALQQGDLVQAFGLLTQARHGDAAYLRQEMTQLSQEIGGWFPHKGLQHAVEGPASKTGKGQLLAIAWLAQSERMMILGADQRLVLTGSDDDEPHVVAENVGTAASCAVDQHGTSAVVAGPELGLQLYDLQTSQPGKELMGHAGGVADVGFSAPHRVFLSAGDDMTIRLWHPQSGVNLKVLGGHQAKVTALEVSPDGNAVASGDASGTVVVTDLSGERQAASFTVQPGAVTRLIWLNDQQQLLTIDEQGVLRLCHLATNQVRTVLGEAGEQVQVAAVTGDGRFVIVGCADARLAVYELASGTLIHQIATLVSEPLGLTLTNDDYRLAVASIDGVIRTWDLEWDPEVRPFAEWDDGAQPYLERHLKRLGDAKIRLLQSGVEQLGDADLKELLTELRHGGFGWLTPSGVRAALASRLGIDQQPAAQQQERSVPVAEEKPRPKQPPKLTIGRLVAVALIILAVPLVLLFNYLRLQHGVHLNDQEVEVTRTRVSRGVVPMERISARVTCDRGRFAEYLEAFTQGGARRITTEEAMVCLAELGNTQNVQQILDELRTHANNIASGSRRGGSFTQTGSILTYLDDATLPAQIQALLESDQVFSKIIAAAIVARSSEVAISKLLEYSADPDPRVRRTISSLYAEIISSEQLTPEQALGLATQWAQDRDPEVRQNTAEGLKVLTGGKVKELLESLENDPHAEVRAAAQRTLHMFR